MRRPKNFIPSITKVEGRKEFIKNVMDRFYWNVSRNKAFMDEYRHFIETPMIGIKSEYFNSNIKEITKKLFEEHMPLLIKILDVLDVDYKCRECITRPICLPHNEQCVEGYNDLMWCIVDVLAFFHVKYYTQPRFVYKKVY
jgi:hypothetical protein